MIAEAEISTVEETLRSQFAKMVGMETAELDMDANLFEVYGLASIRALKLISDIEVEFDIDIEQEEAREICSLNDVIVLIHAKNGHA